MFSFQYENVYKSHSSKYYVKVIFSAYEILYKNDKPRQKRIHKRSFFPWKAYEERTNENIVCILFQRWTKCCVNVKSAQQRMSMVLDALYGILRNDEYVAIDISSQCSKYPSLTLRGNFICMKPTVECLTLASKNILINFDSVTLEMLWIVWWFICDELRIEPNKIQSMGINPHEDDTSIFSLHTAYQWKSVSIFHAIDSLSLRRFVLFFHPCISFLNFFHICAYCSHSTQISVYALYSHCSAFWLLNQLPTFLFYREWKGTPAN